MGGSPGPGRFELRISMAKHPGSARPRRSIVDNLYRLYRPGRLANSVFPVDFSDYLEIDAELNAGRVYAPEGRQLIAQGETLGKKRETFKANQAPKGLCTFSARFRLAHDGLQGGWI